MASITNADAAIRAAMIEATIPNFEVNGDRSAALFAWKDGTPTEFTIEHDDNPDPYELLSHYQTAVMTEQADRPDGIVLISRGWARPMMEDGEPGDEKLRCVACCATTVTGTGTMVQIYPGGTEQVDPSLAKILDSSDDALGTGGGGPLAEAIDMVGVGLFGYQYAARLFAHAIEHHDTKTGEHLQRRAELAARGAAIAQHLLAEEEGNDDTATD